MSPSAPSPMQLGFLGFVFYFSTDRFHTHVRPKSPGVVFSAGLAAAANRQISICRARHPSTMRLMALGLYSEPLSLSSPVAASSWATLRKLRRSPVFIPLNERSPDPVSCRMTCPAGRGATIFLHDPFTSGSRATVDLGCGSLRLSERFALETTSDTDHGRTFEVCWEGKGAA